MNKFPLKTIPKPIRLLFLWIGIFSAFCFRIIIVIKHFNPDYVTIIWYIGVFGYISFFSYRYYIAVKRKNVVSKLNLINKVSELDCISDTDKKAMLYLLKSIDNSPERYNYLIIFIFSIVAIATDLILNFSK